MLIFTLPVRADQPGLLKRINVISECQRNDICLQAIQHSPALLARSAMRLLDCYLLAGLLLPVGGEGLVVVLIQLTRWIIGYIQQLDWIFGLCLGGFRC